MSVSHEHPQHRKHRARFAPNPEITRLTPVSFASHFCCSPQRYEVIFDGETEVSKYLKKDGLASAKFANEDRYVGEYRNGKRHGHGVYTFANGAKYDGDYVDGVKEGRGSMLLLDTSTYVGDWKSDKREGHGIYTYASGDRYEGGWKKNQKHGLGTYFYAKNGSSITGEWSNGQIMHGTWNMADGSKFVGAWHKNIPSGTGLHVFANGNQLTGKYSIDRKLGYKWNSTRPQLGRASDTPPTPVPADPLKIAERFIEKCVLKIDHFEGIGRQFKLVDGAPNFRRINDQAIFACGQPTLTGLKNLFEYVGEQYQVDKFVWINLRTEPIVYVNENSFIPRSKHALNTPMSLAGLATPIVATPVAAAAAASDAASAPASSTAASASSSSSPAPILNATELNSIESQLVTKLIKDISHRGNLHTYLKDTFAEVPEDRKNLELQEEVVPNEEGLYTDAIKTVGAVFETLIEEDGIDLEYLRLPISSNSLPSFKDFDTLVQLVKNADPSTGFVFNDQMGRGRATYGSILVTLMRRTSEALLSADERESTTLGRTDIEGLDLQEYDDSEPSFKLGQYGLIMRLIKVLPSGDQIKAEVDDAIERCKVMHHARESILQAKEMMEKELAASERSSVTQEERIAFWTNQAQMLIERYAYLLLFQTYIKANVETEYENQTFEQFLQTKPEWLEIIGTRENGPIAEFKWQ